MCNTKFTSVMFYLENFMEYNKFFYFVATMSKIFNIEFNLIYDDDIDKRYKLRQKAITADKSLTEDEKSEVLRMLTDKHDDNKSYYNEGENRICENCQQKMFRNIIL